SGGVASGASRPGLGGLDLAVLERRVRDELVEQASGDPGDVVDGALEGLGVRLRRLRGPADLADVLKRRRSDLVLSRRRLEVVERSDVAAHAPRLAYASRRPCFV